MGPFAAITILLLIACAPAQQITAIGGNQTVRTNSVLGKGNAIEVETSSFLLEFEAYLDVPGPETLTFYVYRHHSPAGDFQLVNTWDVAVDGTGVGRAWYSSGPVVTPLLCGNSYVLGVSWPGLVTYHYTSTTCGQGFRFGTWLSGSTVVHPPPVFEPVACDVAQYRHRYTTVPISEVDCVGTGCSRSGGSLPRIVPTTLPALGTALRMELVGGSASAAAVVIYSFAPRLPSAVPAFGCSTWLDLSAVMRTSLLVLSPTGEGSTQLLLPSDPILVGTEFSAQAGVIAAGIDLTGAVGFTAF